ncbi:MAG: hypothetical protein ABW086_14630 [Sedimenticola sp.]
MLATLSPAQAEDKRQFVQMPEMMREHMLANMRDHLLALEEITRYLAGQQYDQAAEVAENRLGMSSLESHGASHMAQFMPREMGAIGTNMHRAASRFALAAKNAELEGGLHKAFSSLSEVMQQCVACHSGYRVH